MIDFFRGERNAVKCAKELSENNEVMTLAAPTLLELATGTALAQSSREKEQLSAFLSSVTVLPLDKKAALLAGELNALLITGGEVIEPMDVQIGAIAATRNERLITRNLKHFRRIPGLEIGTY